MAKFLLLAVLSLVFVLGSARHIHPSSVGQTEEDVINDSEPIIKDIDGMPIVSTLTV